MSDFFVNCIKVIGRSCCDSVMTKSDGSAIKQVVWHINHSINITLVNNLLADVSFSVAIERYIMRQE